MGVRLAALPQYLDRWHVRYELVDGWETRSRGSGDFVDVMGIGAHHTASNTTPAKDEAWCIHNSPDEPIGNGLLLRSGVFRLWSVRATNTQGKGGPYLSSRGTIPKDSGNSRFFAIEAANDGLGEPWPLEQIDTYLLLCCALIDCITHETPGVPPQVGDILAHFEWAPGRKFDPAGNSPYAAGGALWDMDAFRGDVFARLMAGPDPETAVGGDQGDDDMTDDQLRAITDRLDLISKQLGDIDDHANSKADHAAAQRNGMNDNMNRQLDAVRGGLEQIRVAIGAPRTD